MTIKRLFFGTFIFGLLLLGLLGCNMPQDKNQVTSTLNVTQAYQTVDARLTQALLTAPAITQPPTRASVETSTPTPIPTDPLSPTVSQATASQATNCNLAGAGIPIDVTIPDNSQMYPGGAFIKTWRLQNIGTCSWKGYVVAYFSGELMGAPSSVSLPQEVAPGHTVDISVDMVAPKTPGIYQSNWKLRTDSGAWFGIGPQGNAPFWVRIEVIPAPTETVVTLTPAETPTPTLELPVTKTPGVQARGTVILPVNSLLDLDTNRLDNGGEDVSYAQDSEGKHILTPVDNAAIGIYGADQPSYAVCASMAFSGNGIVVENLSLGTYLCFRTNAGRTGRLLLLNVNLENFNITLDSLTWDIQ